MFKVSFSARSCTPLVGRGAGNSRQNIALVVQSPPNLILSLSHFRFDRRRRLQQMKTKKIVAIRPLSLKAAHSKLQSNASEVGW